MANLNTRSLLMVAGLGGLAMGVLSSIPLVSCVNCLLCAWIWGGGIFSVWWYRRMEAGSGGTEPTLDTTQGLIVGAASGLVAAVVSIILGFIVGAGSTAALSQLGGLSQNETASQLASLTAGAGVGLFIRIIIYPLFGAVGGFLAVNYLFKPKTSAPPPAM